MASHVEFHPHIPAENVSCWFTITRLATGKGRYIYQMTEPSYFGVVELRIEPYVGPTPFLLEWCVTEEQIPIEYLSAVLRGIQQAAQQERPNGPLTNIKVVVVDGAHHVVDSSEYSYTKATIKAFEDALSQTEIVPLAQKA